MNGVAAVSRYSLGLGSNRMSKSPHTSKELFLPESLLSRLMDDKELMKEVLDACMPDLASNYLRFLAQLEEGVVEDAVRTIHSIKGTAQNADLKALAVLSREVEECLRRGQLERVRMMLEELSTVVEGSVQAVEGYFSS